MTSIEIRSLVCHLMIDVRIPPHILRWQPIFAILNQLVVEGAPGYLALSALILRCFAILAHGLRAQIWINKRPDCGPHRGHGRCGPAVIQPDIRMKHGAEKRFIVIDLRYLGFAVA